SEGRYQFGEIAWQQARRAPREVNTRYWHRLSTQPLSPALGPARHTADLAHAHLATLFPDTAINEPVSLAVPGAMDTGQLSLLLGILQSLPVEISAVIHRSALVGAHLGQPCAHIEVQLHQASVTVIDVDNGEAHVGDTGLLPGCGLLGLLDEIAEAIGQQFVAQTRFDPQRRADTEQALYEQMPELLKRLSTQSEVSCTVDNHTARINADTLRPVGEALSRELRQALPDSIGHIALDTLLSDLPGLSLPHPITEIAPSVLWQAVDAHVVPTEGELVFQRRLACQSHSTETPPGTPVVASPSSIQTTPSREATQATHQVVSGRAMLLVAGAPIAPGVELAAPGTLLISPSTLVHLNGQACKGEVSIQPGDRLVVGTLEVLFISVED
ncbi:MAG: hypothetical protein HOJ46_01725, partial [Halieaceae bacterium]|nr:hypothetical protein [Halieaceae bacterium]